MAPGIPARDPPGGLPGRTQRGPLLRLLRARAPSQRGAPPRRPPQGFRSLRKCFGLRGLNPLRCLGGGLRFVARRAMNPHVCAPASRGPFPEDPGIRGPLHPLRLRCPPHRTAVGTLWSSASPEAAHRPSRCTASSATPWRPASLRPPSCGCCALYRGTRGDAGGSAKRPVERGRNRVERNRQRAGAGRERSGSPPRARVPEFLLVQRAQESVDGT